MRGKRTRPDFGAQEAARHGAKRSSHWEAVEREFRTAHPRCIACPDDAASTAIQVHHINPFHYVTHPRINRPDLELDPRNLISACETEHGRPAPNHHELICHLGNFKEGNLLAREDMAGHYRGMTADQIRRDPTWQSEEHAGRVKPLDEFTDADFDAFKSRLARDLPPDPAICARFGIDIEKLG